MQTSITETAFSTTNKLGTFPHSSLPLPSLHSSRGCLTWLVVFFSPPLSQIRMTPPQVSFYTFLNLSLCEAKNLPRRPHVQRVERLIHSPPYTPSQIAQTQSSPPTLQQRVCSLSSPMFQGGCSVSRSSTGDLMPVVNTLINLESLSSSSEPGAKHLQGLQVSGGLLQDAFPGPYSSTVLLTFHCGLF